MKRTLLALSFASIAGAAEPALRETPMFLGEQRMLPARDLQAFSVGVPDVVDVKSNPDRLVVTASHEGQTSLLLLYRDGRSETLLISVYARPAQSIITELKTALGDLDGIQVREVNGRIFLDGRMASAAQLDRVTKVAALYPGQVQVLAQVDPTRFEQRINVRLDVYFVDLSRSAGHQLGMSWPASLPGPGAQALTLQYDLLAGSTRSATYSISSNALPTLDMLSTSGWAKVRKRTTLVTTNGTKATVRSGGEINVAIGGAVGGELRTIPFGADVAVTPRYDADTGRVELQVEAEASELSAGGGQVPGRSLSRVNTIVHVRPGQTVALTGVNSESERASETGLPLLRQIPILGFFFGSESAGKDDREGTIFITPTVLHQTGAEDERRMREMFERFERFGD